MFLYLEVLKASFSFDGVIGAFASRSNASRPWRRRKGGMLSLREFDRWTKGGAIGRAVFPQAPR
jgi:hypothetical protein